MSDKVLNEGNRHDLCEFLIAQDIQNFFTLCFNKISKENVLNLDIDLGFSILKLSVESFIHNRRYIRLNGVSLFIWSDGILLSGFHFCSFHNAALKILSECLWSISRFQEFNKVLKYHILSDWVIDWLNNVIQDFFNDILSWVFRTKKELEDILLKGHFFRTFLLFISQRLFLIYWIYRQWKHKLSIFQNIWELVVGIFIQVIN